MNDSQTVRWGIVGPGRIASLVIKDFPYVAGAEAVAVASRSVERAQTFATEHDLARAYGSYSEIMADDGVDVITSPHRIRSIMPLPSPP
jgi:predicted dehydrogenase